MSDFHSVARDKSVAGIRSKIRQKQEITRSVID